MSYLALRQPRDGVADAGRDRNCRELWAETFGEHLEITHENHKAVSDPFCACLMPSLVRG